MNQNVWRAGSKSVSIPETEHLPAAELRIQCGNGYFSRKIARITAEAGNAYLATGLTPLRLAADRADLLEVAKDFEEALGELGLFCECGEADCRTTRLRAAIAKATGQPHE